MMTTTSLLPFTSESLNTFVFSAGDQTHSLVQVGRFQPRVHSIAQLTQSGLEAGASP